MFYYFISIVYVRVCLSMYHVFVVELNVKTSNVQKYVFGLILREKYVITYKL